MMMTHDTATAEIIKLYFEASNLRKLYFAHKDFMERGRRERSGQQVVTISIVIRYRQHSVPRAVGTILSERYIIIHGAGSGPPCMLLTHFTYIVPIDSGLITMRSYIGRTLPPKIVDICR